MAGLRLNGYVSDWHCRGEAEESRILKRSMIQIVFHISCEAHRDSLHGTICILKSSVHQVYDRLLSTIYPAPFLFCSDENPTSGYVPAHYTHRILERILFSVVIMTIFSPPPIRETKRLGPNSSIWDSSPLLGTVLSRMAESFLSIHSCK